MPVHNGGELLDIAIGSILDQSFGDFEFVILDDGSTDGSAGRIRGWAERDRRIRLVEGKVNLGPAESSNAVVRHSRGELVARMDADDVSLTGRLERQVALMRGNPAVGMVGSLCEHIDMGGRVLRAPEFWRLHRRSCFSPCPHGSIMFRRELFDRVGGYRRECEYWEDQDFILRMASAMDCLVIPEPLYQHRQSAVSTRVASKQKRVEQAIDRMYRSLDRLERGEDYDVVLREFGSERGAKVDPRVFVSIGSLRLWAGQRPMLIGDLFRRGRLGANRKSVSALGWTAWAAISPGSLRAFLKFMFRVKNRKAARTFDQAPVAWQPSCGPRGTSPVRDRQLGGSEAA